MLSIEKRIDLLLEAVEEDTFEPNVFNLIREGKLDVVPDTDGQPLFMYYHEGQFTSVDIEGNILNNYETQKATDTLDEEETIMDYVLKEKLECGCWSGIVDHFYHKLTCNVTERLQIMNEIHNFIYEDDAIVKKFICFTTDKLEDVDSTDEMVLTNNSPDGNYPLMYVATLDAYYNPALFLIDKEEIKSGWFKDNDGDEYYVSPKTKWMYWVYNMKCIKSEKNTDMCSIVTRKCTYKEYCAWLNDDASLDNPEIPVDIVWNDGFNGEIKYKETIERLVSEYEKTC